MRALVTGATGLLGNNLVRLLVAAGYEVRAVVRDAAKAEAQLGGLAGVTWVRGDLDDVAALGPALEGVDVVFHTAAYFREYFGTGEHERLLRARNVDATVALARLAHAHGVRRFVHTSSSGTLQARADGAPSTADDVADPDTLDNRYFASKVHADRALAALATETGLDVVTILPGWMFGPGDAAPTGAGQLVLDAIAGRLPPVALPGSTSTVDARDVAAAMVRAAEVGRAGDRFIVGGRVTPLATVLRLLAQQTQRRPPAFTLPYAAAWAFALGSELVGRATGRDPLVTRTALRTLQHAIHLDSTPAERALGTTFRPLPETLADTAAWFLARA